MQGNWWRGLYRLEVPLGRPLPRHFINVMLVPLSTVTAVLFVKGGWVGGVGGSSKNSLTKNDSPVCHSWVVSTMRPNTSPKLSPNSQTVTVLTSSVIDVHSRRLSEKTIVRARRTTQAMARRPHATMRYRVVLLSPWVSIDPPARRVLLSGLIQSASETPAIKG